MGEEKETIVLEKKASEKSRTGQKLCGNQVLCERILDGWLKMSTAISNERLVCIVSDEKQRHTFAYGYAALQASSDPETSDECHFKWPGKARADPAGAFK